MNEAELLAELNRLKGMVPGGNAWVNISLNADRPRDSAAMVSFYPTGITKSHGQHYEAPTFAEAIAKAEAGIRENSAAEIAEIVRKMSVAIMEITMESGRCTDAALRVEGFRQAEIEAHHAAAVARAEEMAGSGPFSVAFLAVKANTPEAA